MPVIGFMSKTAKNFMKNNCFNIIFNLCVSMQKNYKNVGDVEL